MTEFILFWCALTAISCNADDSRSTVAVGAVAGNQKGLVLGDFNQFDQDIRSWGFNRYGGGYSYGYAGNSFGINAGDSSGVLLFEPENKTAQMAIGVESASGQFSVNTNSDIYSFYAWTPMLAVGPNIRFSDTYKLILMAKGGGAVSDMGHNGLSPYVRAAYGGGLYFDTQAGKVSVNKTFFGENSLSSLDLDCSSIGGHIDSNKGLKEETNYVLMYRWKL